MAKMILKSEADRVVAAVSAYYADSRDERIADLERRLGRFLSLYKMFGTDGMTDAKFAEAFERVYLDVAFAEHQHAEGLGS